MVQISVIIPTRNRLNDLHRCLKGLLTNNQKLLKEVIIVDDFSHESLDLSSFVKYLPIKIIRNDKKLGASMCRNIASQYVNSEIIAFLDDDAVPSSDWLDTIAKELNKDRGAITGRVIRFDRGLISRARQARYDKRYESVCYAEKVSFFSGGNSAVWTHLFRKYGGFNQFGSGSDNSLVESLNKQGYYVHFIPELFILHRNSKGLRIAIREAYHSGISHPKRMKINDMAKLAFNFQSSAVGQSFPVSLVNWFLNLLHLFGRIQKPRN